MYPLCPSAATVAVFVPRYKVRYSSGYITIILHTATLGVGELEKLLGEWVTDSHTLYLLFLKLCVKTAGVSSRTFNGEVRIHSDVSVHTHHHHQFKHHKKTLANLRNFHHWPSGY